MKEKRQKMLQLAALLAMGSLLICAFQQGFFAEAVAYKNGSSGETVRRIQEKLVRWGYMDGAVDGIYGPVTEKAVRLFQQKNGLAVDGICGDKTLAALGIVASASGSGQGSGSSGVTAGREEEAALLARIISAEARGEPYVGQVAVGAVIMNRVKHSSFPDTLSGVIYQPGAFTAIVDGQFNQPVADSARRAAADAMNGMDPSGGAIYYYNPAKTTNGWIWSRPVITTIGSHIFAA